MSNYTKSTDFASKDTLSSGDSAKIVRGTEIDAEFEALETAVNSKINVTDIGSTVQAYDADLTTLGAGGASARSFLGLAIGTNVQAWDADLDTWAGKTAPSGTVVGTSDTQTLTNKTLTSPIITGLGSSLITTGTTVASTSGTSIDFTSIPSWVKRITVMFAGVSTNGSSNLLVQLGAGSVTSSGYVGGGWASNTTNTTATTGFFATVLNSSTRVNSGVMTISSMGSNTWVENTVTFNSTGNDANTSGGYVTLGGTLDRIRITTVNGTDAFDAGSVNILYE